MADGLVSAVVETVVGILKTTPLQEIGLLWGLEDELNKLASTLVTIQLVLQDAEMKQRKNEAIHDWLRKLKHTACDAENILDRIATEGLTQRLLDSKRGIHHKLKSFLSSRNPLLFRSEMAHQVKSIRGKLDAIAEERLKFHLGEGVIENRFGVTILESRQTSSLVNESKIFGRHDEKEMIIERLVNVTPNQDIGPCVYAIQGMGGLGKTTLAQLVYNDERTKTHFDLRIWVCVSDDFNIQVIVRAIMESIDGDSCNVSTLDALHRLLQGKLRGKRFVLVLDDVWNENHGLWDELKEVLRCGSKGSVIMVTTRIEKIAMMMATIGVHHIRYLSEGDSWSLFRQRAFTTGDGEENLVVIGKAIVKKCGGVPLAIKALGSLMRFKSLESEWLAVKESEIWQLSDDENGILPALRLSYDNLLPQMRQCFAYCCIFPKDYRMEKDKLIELWMANGYLHIDGETNVQLVGHLIFKELVWRSFLQDHVESFMGNKVICTMHDLMHDLASSVMRHETYIIEYGKVLKAPKSLLHLSFSSDLSKKVPHNQQDKLILPIDNSLRSIIVCGEDIGVWRQGFYSLLSKQRFLRALDMSYLYMIENLPNLVCKLEHLRYLVIPCHNVKRIPESLTRLQNLQTLRLTHSHDLLELPKRLKVMKKLWFLDMQGFDSLLCTPPQLGELICLRRLSVFIVGEDTPHHIGQLKELNLSGQLSIQALENVRDLKDAESANLLSKKDLTSLTFSWTKGGNESNSVENLEEVLCGLQPHHNLEKICIKSYQGSVFPNWMSNKALKEIDLGNCQRAEHLPQLGKLPFLTSLKLHDMTSVKCLDDEWHGRDDQCSFLALTTLTVCCMPNLEEWTRPHSIESFPSLKHLEIQLCPKLTELPKLPSLTSLHMFDPSVALLTSVRFVASLTSLIIARFAEEDVFPQDLLQNHKALEHLQILSLPIRSLSNLLDNLSALKRLSLDHCTNLDSFTDGLKSLDSLEELDIRSCDCLRSFPATILETLPSVRYLSFQNCKKLIPLTGSLNSSAPALQHLTINGLPELDQLPESLQQLSSLRSLTITLCERLSLPNWLWRLESLSEINIHYCEKLRSLPDGFNSLKSLRKLVINGCPAQLERRCKKPKGEDWPKISDIPYIEINYEVIQRLDQ